MSEETAAAPSSPGPKNKPTKVTDLIAIGRIQKLLGKLTADQGARVLNYCVDDANERVRGARLAELGNLQQSSAN